MKAVKFLSMAAMAFVLWTSLASFGGGNNNGGEDNSNYTTLTVNTAGSLPTLFQRHQEKITCLKLKGKLNGTDIRYIREISGNTGYLEKLDLSEARIVAGGYYMEDIDGTYYNTTDNEISEEMFKGCIKLSYVAIPNSVTNIRDEAFAGCSGLTSITIPKSVTNIGDNAFWGCFKLTSVTIPNSVTRIRDDVFAGCSGLTSITIPNSVTNIGDNAFAGCIGLTSVTIPKSVTNIGDNAFSGCFKLTSITIPNSVTNIGDDAFTGCIGLTSVTIPNSVTNIGDNAFALCSGLTNIYSLGTTPASCGDGVFYNVNSSTCTLHVPAGCTTIYEKEWGYFSSIVDDLKK